MRAGCFAERRVIDLFNRRFVCFYFNRSGMGDGADAAATAFVGDQTENPYAYLAAFSPDGKLLGETDLYADKDDVFAWAQSLLSDHSEFDAAPTGERLLRDGPKTAERALRCARLDEELGRYDAAVPAYVALTGTTDNAVIDAASAALLRIARYRKQWALHEELETRLRNRALVGSALELDLDLERGRRLLTAGSLDEARLTLQGVARRAAEHPRRAEAHFYAGVACWTEGDRDWAKLHWCTVVEQIPDDRLARRAYIAAAAEGMPYENPELDGFKADVGSIGVGHIMEAYRDAARIYRGLLPVYESGADFGDPVERLAIWQAGPNAVVALVAGLKDGNKHVPSNNEMVDELEVIGAPAVETLVLAIQDPEFEGRGYAAWGLSQVLKAGAIEDPEAVAALRRAAKDADPYVAALAGSGLSSLGRR